MVAFCGQSSLVVFMRQVRPKERPLQGPFLISNYQTRQAIALHLRTNSRNSVEPHPAPAGRRRRSTSCGSPDHRDVRDNVSLKFDSLSGVLSDKTHTTTRKRSDTGHSRKDVQAMPRFANISMPRKIVRVVQQRLAVSRLPEIQSFLSPGAVACLCNSMVCKNGCLQC